MRSMNNNLNRIDQNQQKIDFEMKEVQEKMEDNKTDVTQKIKALDVQSEEINKLLVSLTKIQNRQQRQEQ